MQPFTLLTGIAAPLPMINVDTDKIIPKQYLKTIHRSGLGKHLFDEMRYDDTGQPIADFVLNQEPWDRAEILIAGDNFGCGSSREHAVWALLDFGIRCVIAPGFADIFNNNCLKNGVLTVQLDQDSVACLMAAATTGDESAMMTVDLGDSEVRDANGNRFAFEIEAFRRDCLMRGLDEIGTSLMQDEAITAYEARRDQTQPWLVR